MITYSQQHKIISDLSLSFSKIKKTFTKPSEKILNRDKQFFNYKKYETFTLLNFKFLVLWTVFKNNSSKIDTMKIINNYTDDDIKNIQKEREKIILYKNTLNKDKKFMLTKAKTTDVIFSMYIQNNISLLYMYHFNKNNKTKLSRIQTKQLNRIIFFISFFPKIEEYLKDIKHGTKDIKEDKIDR